MLYGCHNGTYSGIVPKEFSEGVLASRRLTSQRDLIRGGVSKTNVHFCVATSQACLYVAQYGKV